MKQLITIAAVVLVGCASTPMTPKVIIPNSDKTIKHIITQINIIGGNRITFEWTARYVGYLKLNGSRDLHRFDVPKITEWTNVLEKCSNIKLLDLGQNELTNVKGIEKLGMLKKLYLNNNQLTDVKWIETLTNLEILSLSSNQLTSVKGLEKLTKLKFLHLNWNDGLSKREISQLQKSLPNCNIYVEKEKR